MIVIINLTQEQATPTRPDSRIKKDAINRLVLKNSDKEKILPIYCYYQNKVKTFSKV